MVGKMVKMLFCVVVMFCYLKFVNVQRGAFVISFMLYYLVFLTYETMAQYGFERRQRERNGVC